MNRFVAAIPLALAGAFLLAPMALAAGSTDAHVRVLHASPDAPAVDVYADGTKVLSNVPFGVISDYLAVPAGSHKIQVFATGQTSNPVIDATLKLAANTSYTVAATNAVASIEAKVIVDDPKPASNTAQVRAVHLSADAPAVDVAPRGSAVDAAVVKGLAYPDNSGYLNLPAGSYDLSVRVAGQTAVALQLPTLAVRNGQSYSVFVIGSAAAQPVGGHGLTAVVATDAMVKPAMPATDTVDATTSGVPSLLVLAVVAIAAIATGLLASRRFATRTISNR